MQNLPETPAPSTARSMDRRDAVWSACDELAAQGIKPSLTKVRATHRGGSDTDVQADIGAWFARVFKNHVERTDGLGLPKDVAALMAQLWEAARGAADAQVAGQAKALEESRSLARQEVEREIDRRQAAEAKASALETELAATRERAENLSIANIELRSREESIRADNEALDQRLAKAANDLAELARKASEDMAAAARSHADEVRAEREAKAAELAMMRDDMASRLAELERQHRLAEERYRGLERNLLMEIDRARSGADEAKRAAKAAKEEVSARETQIKIQNDALRNQAAELSGELKATKAAMAQAQRDAHSARARLEDLLRSAPPQAALEARPTPMPEPSPKPAPPRPSPRPGVDASDYE